jgi:MFS family permease
MLSLLTIPSAYVHLPQHARDLRLDVPRSTFIMIVGLSALLGNLLLGRLSDILGRRGALLLSSAVGVVAFAGFTLAESAPELYLASAAFGLHYGSFASLFPAVVGDFFGRLHAGSLAGFSFALGGLSAAIGPVATGLIADRAGQYFVAFLGAAVVNLVGLALLALARPPESGDADASP